jgi:hypothetical protein
MMRLETRHPFIKTLWLRNATIGTSLTPDRADQKAGTINPV